MIKLGSLAFLATMILGPLAATAQEYRLDFSGTVTGATGVYAGAGSTISGTYTIDFAAANAAAIGTVGDLNNAWSRVECSGAFCLSPVPAPDALVFSTEFSTGSVSYSDRSVSVFGSQSQVLGYNVPLVNGVPNTWQGSDYSYLNPGLAVFSYVLLYGGTGAGAPFDTNGLPLLSNIKVNSFTHFSQFNYIAERDMNTGATLGTLGYNITSISVEPTSAPEIDPASAASALTLLLGGLMVLRGKKRIPA